MAQVVKHLRLDHLSASWRFLLFGIVALLAGATACPLFGWIRGTMLAFDIAAIIFTGMLIPLLKNGAKEMRELAAKNDANRGILLLIASLVTGVILASVWSELSKKGRPEPIEIALVLITLSLCWMFSTIVYTLHYAHLYYQRDTAGKDRAGLSFPNTQEPNYWDFGYFSSCLAMTFQTSDVEIRSGKIRRTVIFHTLGAFIFNIGVIAFSINILGGSR